MAVAGDVPNKFDLVVNGEGYLVVDVEDVKAVYGYTPTFVTRQNVQGDYGDQFQDFWLTATQNDWSLGEDQKFFRAGDPESRRRFYQGSNLDARIEGQVSMRDAIKSVTPAATVVCAVTTSSGIYYATSTNLYLLSTTGAITDKGAHGLGASPTTPNGIATDGPNVYLSAVGGGSVGVRRWSGAAFSTFSATGSDELAFLNNTLYGVQTSGVLRRYDTAGVATTLFTWATATGGATGDGAQNRILSLGGKLLIFRGQSANGTSEGRAELWIYDGTSPSLIEAFEPNFYANAITVSQGIVFLGGVLQGPAAGYGAVMYYANGTAGLLWKSPRAGQVQTICSFDGGLVWADSATSQYVYYNIASGGVQRLGTIGVASQGALVGGVYNFISYGTAIDFYPDSVKATTSTVTTSLFDFDSSVDKLFRGIKVDFDSATTGDGGSVDISYRVGDVVGSYTSLQTGAVSGTECLLTNITGRSVAVKVTLNKGTSTAGPVLKRVSVRAVPKQFNFRRNTFVLNLTGRDGEMPITLRDGTSWSQDGLAMATTLRTLATTQTPVSITDEFGTYTGIIENDGFQIKKVRPNEFIAVVPVREV